jgi:hypothetical protein
VSTDKPTIEVALSLAGDGYVARVHAVHGGQPIATISLPRAVVDRVVLDAAQARLEVRLDSTASAYADAGLRTLTNATLCELVSAAASPDAVAGEDNPKLVRSLEAELERALDIVRRARP